MGNICGVKKGTSSCPDLFVCKNIRGNDTDTDLRLVDSVSKFAVRFCYEQDKSRSSVCSPLSAQCVLALTALGCAGASRAELLAAMDLRDDDHIRSSFTFLTTTLKSIEGVTLKIANRVYVTKNGILKPEIQNDAVEVFDSGLEQIDFSDNAAAAAINQWVAKQTGGMIKDIISPGSLNSDTSLLLVNTIYFQILQMDYQGGQSSLVIVLPDKMEGLGDVMQQLVARHNLMGEIARLSKTKVEVIVPKFKVETAINLKQLLPKMGIKSIFDKSTSNIQMLTDQLCPLYVSQAVQKAVIEVDEAGTKAAACTYTAVQLCSKNLSAPEKPKFIADHPFLVVLTAGQIPLFLGIYMGSEFTVQD